MCINLEGEPHMKLKVMTYNIFSGRNLARDLNIDHAASVIRSVQPDFVTINEVRCRTSDIGPVDQANELGRRTGYYPVFAKTLDIMGGEYGIGLLSRLPVLESEVVHIPDVERTENYHYEHRCILRCRLLAGEQTFTVLCTHFGLAPSEQASAVSTALTLLENESIPVLLMGDLNAEPGTPEVQPLFERMQDASEGKGLLTFPSDTPKIKIDHILYTGPWKVLDVYSIDTQNSDHRPLIAEMELG